MCWYGLSGAFRSLVVVTIRYSENSEEEPCTEHGVRVLSRDGTESGNNRMHHMKAKSTKKFEKCRIKYAERFNHQQA